MGSRGALMGAVLASALVLLGCVDRGAYVCAGDADCVAAGSQGTCEVNHACSFADPSCPDSLRRFGGHAGALSNQCVDAATCALRCDEGDPCTAEACVAGDCRRSWAGGPCEDGLECTLGDVCLGGRCASGAWDDSAACAAQGVPVYRSVGPMQALALAGGAGNPLSLAGGVARFAGALPDEVGVGDVLQYDTDGDGAADALAFVHARASATEYAVRDAGGFLPAPTSAPDASWAVYRAYTSLADALAMSENPSLDPALRDFEACPGDCDLPARHRSHHLACYAGVDDTRVFVGGAWGTDDAHWLTIFSPRRPDEVGAGQRHDGTWGTGYRRTQGIDVVAPFVRLDGISVRVEVEDRVFLVALDDGRPGRVELAHCFGEMAHPATWFRVYDVFGTAPARVEVSSSIGITRSIDPDSYVFFNNQATATAYFYACTGMALGGAVFRKELGPTHVVNGLAVTAVTAVGFANFQSAEDTIDYSVTTDDSLTGWPGSANTAAANVRLRDGAGGDLHLATDDAAARGHGRNLTTDPELPLTDDIDGDPRPAAGAWDVGADQAP